MHKGAFQYKSKNSHLIHSNIYCYIFCVHLSWIFDFVNDDFRALSQNAQASNMRATMWNRQYVVRIVYVQICSLHTIETSHVPFYFMLRTLNIIARAPHALMQLYTLKWIRINSAVFFFTFPFSNDHQMWCTWIEHAQAYTHIYRNTMDCGAKY